MTRLLLVEDEPGIHEPLTRFLRGEGFDVTVATTAAAARASFVSHPDLVILDWMLPDGQGQDLLTAWRAAEDTTPIIMLTARAELIDKVLGLELGADDYVTKPFEPRELLARIKARLRASEASPAQRKVLAHAGVEIDDLERRVRFHGAVIEMTKMEYDLLKIFVENAGKVFSRDELLNVVWGFDAYPTTRTVDTHVLQLRQKLAPELLETVRGIGYRMSRAADTPLTTQKAMQSNLKVTLLERRPFR